MRTNAATEDFSQSERVGHRVNWADPRLADETDFGLKKHAFVFALLAAGAVLDASLMRSPVMTVLRDSPGWATVAAFGVSALSALAAGWAGYAWAGARGNHPRHHLTLAVPALVMILWAALGASIYWLRLTAAGGLSQAHYAGSHDAASTTGGGHVAAAVFMTVYAIVGLLAFADLKHLRNDAFKAKVKAQHDLERNQMLCTQREAELDRLIENCAIRRVNIAALATQEDLNLDANRALADELKQLSRWEQAVAFGEVEKTGITSALHEMNPANPHTGAGQRDGQQ